MVQRGTRVLVKMAERVPLHETDPKRRKPCIDRSVVAHLQALDREADVLERPGHLAILSLISVLVSAYLYQRAFLSML